MRTLFLASTLGLAGIGVAAAIALATLATETSRASVQVGRELDTVLAMAAAQVQVLVYSRESLLLAETGDPVHARARDEARAGVSAALEAAMRSADGLGDQARVREIDARIGQFIAERDRLLMSDLPPGRQLTVAAPLLDEALVAANRYIADSERAASRMDARVRRLGAAATNAAVVLVVLVPLALALMLRWVRRRVYLPFLGLHDALSAYSAGENDVRASEGGPPEVADMSRTFNELADSLDRQRQTRFEFLLAVAHDLRNPLTALRAALALTDGRLRKGELTREQIEQQQRRLALQVDRLNRMVGDLVDMTRVETGRFDLEVGVCDLGALAAEARDLFEGSSETHPIRLAVSDEPLPVRCDRQRMGQVLDNLISNAIKYSPAGGEVEVRVLRSGGEACIEVQDHGLGIAQESLTRIFEPFQRLHPDQAPGAGLGLSVAKLLVEAQGGHLDVESEEEVGSTFRICLPLAEAAP
ncbi:MAG TPA: HAMP domain-containing sensor histidine kinase [Vulgatibacter sp.]|nr:HAMP domain-containing sensor histidine kinase [Vulgatibacter sp.]